MAARRVLSYGTDKTQIPVTIGLFLYLTIDCELLYMNHHHLFFFSFFSP